MNYAVCRYNPNHKCKKSRIEIHELKCPDRFKKQNDYILCLYNPSHKIKKELYDKHLLECENKPRITKEEEEELRRAQIEQKDMITEQEKIQRTRMKYYKDCVQEPEIPGINKETMQKNKEKRKKIINKRFKNITEYEAKQFVVAPYNNDEQENNIENSHEIENFEGDIDFEIENEDKNTIREDNYYRYNPNDEDKDIGKYSANIINPEEIYRILDDK